MLEWRLYLKAELPDEPLRIAKQSHWGQDQLAKVSILTHTENQADHETGRPALYDNGIDTEYTPNQTHILTLKPSSPQNISYPTGNFYLVRTLQGETAELVVLLLLHQFDGYDRKQNRTSRVEPHPCPLNQMWQEATPVGPFRFIPIQYSETMIVLRSSTLAVGL